MEVTMVDKYASITVESTDRVSDTARETDRYVRLLGWLTKHHAELFQRVESRHKNYVTAWLPEENEGDREPSVRFFWLRCSARRFARNHSCATFEYRYADQREFLL
jgi:hypothetical protein